jgi:hypothetical protein
MIMRHMLHHMIFALKRLIPHPVAIPPGAREEILRRRHEMVLHVAFEIVLARGAEAAVGMEAGVGFVVLGGKWAGGGGEG